MKETGTTIAHTPGPWHVDIDPMGGDIYIQTDKKELLAVVPQNQANAQLIAAAPDLLDALKALHQNVDHDLVGYWTESTSNFMQQAEAAIAKAEGRQP